MNTETDFAAIVARRKRAVLRAQAALTRQSGLLTEAIVDAARSGATQRDIAGWAGVSQPRIAQILARGFVPRGPLGRLLWERREQVLNIAATYGARDVRVFGSVAAGTERPDSDIDLMCEIPMDMGLLTLARMERDISEALDGVKVDLAPARLLKPEVSASAVGVSVPL